MPSELPELHVGDHVQDREADDPAPMVVVGTPVTTAEERDVDAGQTVADYNPEYPADDDVVEVVFAQRTCVDISHAPSYDYPRSRLALVEPVHDIESEEGS